MLDRTAMAPAGGLAKGAYVLVETAGVAPEVILIATGSEVALALEVHARLAPDGIRQPRRVDALLGAVRGAAAVVPRRGAAACCARAGEYRGGHRRSGGSATSGRDGASVGVDRFGASAPGPVVMREFGFTPEHVMATVRTVMARRRPDRPTR